MTRDELIDTIGENLGDDMGIMWDRGSGYIDTDPVHAIGTILDAISKAGGKVLMPGILADVPLGREYTDAWHLIRRSARPRKWPATTPVYVNILGDES